MDFPQLRAIIFDLDGVITATVEYHYSSWQKALEPYQIPFSRQENEKIRSLTRRQSLAVILSGRELPDHIRELILARKNDYYLEYIEDINSDDILPGVVELLGELRQNKIRCGVASASSNSRLVLQRLGLAEYFDTIVDANDITRSKPAPDVYLRAALNLAVGPSACVAIEDSAAGVYSAARAGMCPVALGSAACIPAAQICLPDLSGIRLSILQQAHNAWARRSYQSEAVAAHHDGPGENPT